MKVQGFLGPPAANVHFETEVQQSGVMACTWTCLGNLEKSSNRSVGNFIGAYHHIIRSIMAF
jgi:hypothetical protein